MRIKLSILSLLIQFTMYSQISLKDYYFENSNKKYSLKVIHFEYDTTILNLGKLGKKIILNPNKIIWGLHNSVNDSLIYSFNHLNLHKSSVLISENGNNIILLNQYVNFRKLERNTVALEFLSKGQISKTYKLKKLIDPTEQLIKLRDQGIWCMTDYQILSDSVFKLNTIEFKSFTFDLKTGENISTEFMTGINKKSVILYGVINIDDIETNSYTIEVDNIIQGPKLKYFDYQFQSETKLDEISALIVINEGKYVPTLNKYQIVKSK